MELPIPEATLLGLENPFLVASTSAAVVALGGSQRLGKLINDLSGSTRAAVRLRPDDPSSATIASEMFKTHDVLVKVTTPKLLRIRKRPSPVNDRDASTTDLHGPASAKEPPVHSFKRLLRALKDNPDGCDFETVGRVDHTHRFRGLPDFVAQRAADGLSQKISEAVALADYTLSVNAIASKGIYTSTRTSQLRHNAVLTPGNYSELSPSPQIVLPQIQYKYRFQPNPYAKKVVDESGKVGLVNESLVPKVYTPHLRYDVETVPTAPPAEVPKIEDLEPPMRAMIHAVQQAFEERPIWTRRALANHLNRPEWRHMYKYSYQYVSYVFRSGPWRDAAVKLGIDPRTDPKYRIYQTMIFQLERPPQESQRKSSKPHGRASKSASAATVSRSLSLSEKSSHVFDGKKVMLDGRVWQVCDITDPTLSDILATTSIRHTCELQNDGWFHNGTVAKAHVLMRAMIQHLTGESPAPNANAVARVLNMPDILDEQRSAKQIRREAKEAGPYGELVSAVRGWARAPERSISSQAGVTVAALEGEDLGYDEDMPIDPRLMQLSGGLGLKAMEREDQGSVEMSEGGDDLEQQEIEPEEEDMDEMEGSVDENGTEESEENEMDEQEDVEADGVEEEMELEAAEDDLDSERSYDD